MWLLKHYKLLELMACQRHVSNTNTVESWPLTKTALQSQRACKEQDPRSKLEEACNNARRSAFANETVLRLGDVTWLFGYSRRAPSLRHVDQMSSLGQPCRYMRLFNPNISKRKGHGASTHTHGHVASIVHVRLLPMIASLLAHSNRPHETCIPAN